MTDGGGLKSMDDCSKMHNNKVRDRDSSYRDDTRGHRALMARYQESSHAEGGSKVIK
jgi:hypothetical protein